MALNEETAAKVIRQVEFYFSNSNLPDDKFLLKTLEESEDELVSLPVICSFTRMKNHLGITDSRNIPAEVIAGVAAVLRKSTFLKVSEDGTRVGRVQKLLKPEEAKAEVNARSVAISPVSWNASREEIEAFISSHAKISSVRIPRHPAAKVSFGSALIELDSIDDVKKLMSTPLEFMGVTLEFESKEAFDKRMDEAVASKKNDTQKYDKPKKTFDNFTKGVVVAFKLEKRQENNTTEAAPATTAAATESVPATTEAVPATTEVTPASTETASAIAEAAPTTEAPEAAPVNTEAAPATTEASTEAAPVANESGKGKAKASTKARQNDEDQIAREDLKEALEVYGTIKFIDFKRGDSSGYIRFEIKEDAEKARTAAVISEAGGLIVKKYLLTLEAVQGDAEVEYWKNIRGGQNNRRDFNNRNRRYEKSSRQHQQQKYGGKHKRNDEGADAPHAKTQKSE